MRICFCSCRHPQRACNHYSERSNVAVAFARLQADIYANRGYHDIALRDLETIGLYLKSLERAAEPLTPEQRAEQ